jgi:hypothetical protein
LEFSRKILKSKIARLNKSRKIKMLFKMKNKVDGTKRKNLMQKLPQ